MARYGHILAIFSHIFHRAQKGQAPLNVIDITEIKVLQIVVETLHPFLLVFLTSAQKYKKEPPRRPTSKAANPAQEAFLVEIGLALKKKPGNARKICFWGQGGLGAIFIANLSKQ